MSSHPEACSNETSVPSAVLGGPFKAMEVPDEILELRHIVQLKAMRLPGRPSLFVELSAIFRREAPERMLKIGEALERRDSEQLAKYAHAMVGSLATLGARRMQKAARALEQASLAADWLSIPSAHLHLLECWRELEQAFEQQSREESA